MALLEGRLKCLIGLYVETLLRIGEDHIESANQTIAQDAVSALLLGSHGRRCKGAGEIEEIEAGDAHACSSAPTTTNIAAQPRRQIAFGHTVGH